MSRLHPKLDGALLASLLLTLPTGATLLSGAEAADDTDAGYSAQPLAPASRDGTNRFTLLTPADSGVEFAHELDHKHPLRRLYGSGYVAGGVAIGDLDGDDRPDLFLTSGSDRNRLYRQVDRLRFVDATDDAGLPDADTWSSSAALADVDNDGDLDILVCNYDDPNQLFLNDGAGRFSEAAQAAGLAIDDACLVSAFCDYDRDGDLDVYVIANRLYRAGGRPSKPPVAFRNGRPYVTPAFQKYYQLIRVASGKYHIDDVGRADYLFRNEGDGAFTDVSRAAGLWGVGFGLSVTWWDYNHDSWPDIYVANDFNDPDRLYRNNGDGTFTDVLTETISRTCWFSMGADFGDVNGDGLFDLFVVDMAPSSHFSRMKTSGALTTAKLSLVTGPPVQFMKNTLLLGSPDGQFAEAAELAGLARTDWSWAVKLADYDNDSRLDVFVTNGISRSYNDSDMPIDSNTYIGRTEWDFFENSPTRPEKNFAFRNQGDLQFEDVSDAWGLGHIGMSYSAASGDMDADGDVDLVVTNLNEPLHIYRNDSNDGRRLLVRLRGSQSNHFGIGAIVRVKTADKSQVKMLSPQTGYLSSNDPKLHFGLGDAALVKEVTVDWPSGTRQVLREVTANQLLTIHEPSSGASLATDPAANETTLMYEQVDGILNVRHSDPPYNDYARQPLLPRKLSQFGPSLAVGDFNGDGRDDLFLGGGSGSAGAVLIAGERGRFKRLSADCLNQDRACEDMGAVWLDANADGALDLYVASGSWECAAGAPVLRDRLYLNDGQGGLINAPDGAVPDLRDSSSAVAAADFDRDGDLDLFVGTRVLVGQYPLSGSSRLLENRNGSFVDATQLRAADLATAGMVTSAIWSDANNDGWIDLLVTTDWGPVRYYRNENGRLVEATSEAGLADRTGWYNGIAARDADGDGDIDYAVTNYGLNTRYRASPDNPIRLYRGTFDAAKNVRLIESESRRGVETTVRSKGPLGRALSNLNDRFSTHDSFARATFDKLLPLKQRNQAPQFTCNSLESGLLLNDGSGRFEFLPWPRTAQLAPAFGVLFTEINGNAAPDVYFVENFRHNPPEIGPMDSGKSRLLLGRGDGEYAAVEPSESGLIATGESRSVVQLGIVSNAPNRMGIVVGQNNDEPLTFLRSLRADESSRSNLLRVKLAGLPGNQHAYGAKITVESTEGRQTAEVAAGSGFLSQSTSEIVFARPQENDVWQVRVRWPEGAETVEMGAAGQLLKIVHPGGTPPASE